MLELNFTCVIFILSFLLFTFLLNFTLWKPIRKIKGERSSELLNLFDQAKNAEQKTKSIVEKVNADIESSKKEERDSLDELYKEFNKEKELDEQKTKQQLEEQKKIALSKIAEEESNLLQLVDKESSKLAEQIIERIAPQINLSKGVGTK